MQWKCCKQGTCQIPMKDEWSNDKDWFWNQSSGPCKAIEILGYWHEHDIFDHQDKKKLEDGTTAYMSYPYTDLTVENNKYKKFQEDMKQYGWIVEYSGGENSDYGHGSHTVKITKASWEERMPLLMEVQKEYLELKKWKAKQVILNRQARKENRYDDVIDFFDYSYKLKELETQGKLLNRVK